MLLSFRDRYLLNSPMLPDYSRDADGGLRLYIQRRSPGKENEPNWLPLPETQDWFEELKRLVPVR